MGGLSPQPWGGGGGKTARNDINSRTKDNKQVSKNFSIFKHRQQCKQHTVQLKARWMSAHYTPLKQTEEECFPLM